MAEMLPLKVYPYTEDKNMFAGKKSSDFFFLFSYCANDRMGYTMMD